ncbi:MAG: HDOD domain-containing protein [Syntrophobacteraceae bacterium]
MIRELSNHEVDALHYELLVKDITAAAEKLPPFPDVAWKVTSLIKKMAPIKEIEEAIKFDQVITARVLRLSQSVYYGRSHNVRSLQDAILLLGSKRLIQAIIAACATHYYSSSNSRDDRELWEHSITAALISEIIARRLDQKRVLTIYTAALLHDIGKTVLNVYAKIYLHSSLREIRGESDFVKAERRALGIDHQELGAIVSRKWNFPTEITAAIEHHHNPDNAGQFQEIASIIYLADQLAISSTNTRGNARYQIVPESDAIFKRYGFTRSMIDDCLQELESNLEGVRQVLGAE